LQVLEREQSALEGWISDERGEIRQHINAFVNGEQAQLLLVCRGRLATARVVVFSGTTAQTGA